MSKNTKFIFITSLSLVVSLAATVFAVQATTTVGNNVSVGGNLTVNGNVGVGTTTPGSALEIKNSTSSQPILSLDNAAGTNAVTVLDDGNVGIGTTWPSLAKLQVKGGDIYLTGALGFYQAGDENSGAHNTFYRGGSDIQILRNYNQPYAILDIWSRPGGLTDREATLSLVRGDEPNQEFVDFYNDGYSGAEQYGIRIQKRGTGQYRDFAFEFSDGTTTKEVMRIKPSGNIGIATTTPSAALEIKNSTSSQPILSLDNATGTNAVTVLDNGNIGIGTTTPEARVDINTGATGTIGEIIQGVSGQSADLFQVRTAPNYPALVIDRYGRLVIGNNIALSGAMLSALTNDPGTKGFVIRGLSGQTGNLQEWQDSNGVALDVVSATGTIGIGTTAPGARLDIWKPSSGDILNISSSTAGDLLTIDNSGNVGIGTTAPSEKLDVDGNIKLSGDITDGTYSVAVNQVPKIYQNQNIKTTPKIWTGVATTTSGVATFYLTDDGTSTGNAIFTNIYSMQVIAEADVSSAVDVSLASVKSLSADNKTLTANIVSGITLTALGDTVKFVPDGTKVYATVIGD